MSLALMASMFMLFFPAVSADPAAAFTGGFILVMLMDVPLPLLLLEQAERENTIARTMVMKVACLRA